METTQESRSRICQWRYTDLDHNFTIHGRTLFFVIVLFCVVIIVMLIFFYMRWACRFQDNQILQSTASSRETGVLQGLDPATINSLPTKQHKYLPTVEGNECCICLGVFEDGEKVKVLPQCHHCYHCECVDKWLSAHSSCPLCRASLRVESVVLSIVTD